MKFDPRRVVFMGMGSSPLCYYRCMLPALAMGADWCGLVGEPPTPQFATGMVRSRETGKYGTRAPDILSEDYDIIVLQQVRGPKWAKIIDGLKGQGKKVVYEIDDYVHGIAQQRDHQARKFFNREVLGNVEWAMRHCDGVIVSTEFIAQQYRHFNKRTFVCRNGIDLRRYDLEIPKRPTFNIGWAGAGSGHESALMPWFPKIGQVMSKRSETCFVSIGRRDFAQGFAKVFGVERSIGTPWAQIEQYPAAMTMLDVALAPAGHTPWWRGKSDLRWLEASALGIPVVADPVLYPEIKTGVTGYHAASPEEAFEHVLRLVDHPSDRVAVGQKAKEYVVANRGMDTMVQQWRDAFTELLADSSDDRS